MGILNSDDFLVDGALDHVFHAVPSDESEYVIHGGLLWGRDGQVINKSPAKDFDATSVKSSVMPVRHPATFVSKACYDQHGHFDISFKMCADRDFILRLCKASVKFIALKESLTVMEAGGASYRNYSCLLYTSPSPRDS